MEKENSQNIPLEEMNIESSPRTAEEEKNDLRFAISESKEIVDEALVGLENAGISKDFRHITTVEGTPTTPERALHLLNESIDREHKSTLYTGLNLCSGKCVICRYETLAVPPAMLESRFNEAIDRLMRELDLYKKHVPALNDAEVHSLYIGGGTPSLMTQEQLASLIKQLSDALPFFSPKEITIEGSPVTMLPEKIAAFQKIGVNRFSEGIQGLDDEWLKKVNRRHTSADAFSSMQSLNAAGVRYNVDMMCGFEGQTPESFGSEIQQILKHHPPEITVYPYENKRQTNGRPLFIPPSDLQSSLEMWQTARELCGRAGYREGPLGWWLRPDMKIAQCWIDRWHDQIPLVGLGARGYSWARGAQFENLPLEFFARQAEIRPSYEEALSKGELPINPQKTYEYNPDQQVNRWMSFRLKTNFVTPILGKQKLFNELEKAGLGEIKENNFQLSPSGHAVIEHIMVAIEK